MSAQQQDSDNAGTVGGAIIGSTVGGQAAASIKDILRAKGLAKQHPIIVPIGGGIIGIASVIGGIKAGQKVQQVGRKGVAFIDKEKLQQDIEDKAKKKHGIRKQGMWIPIVHGNI